MTGSRPSEVLESLGRRLQTVVWPESRAALRTRGLRLPPVPHEFASFGQNSWVVPPTRMLGVEHISIGAGVVLMEHCEVRAEAPVHFGDGTRFARFCTVWATEGVRIGAEVLTSDYVAVLDSWFQPYSSHSHRHRRVPQASPVVIEDGAYLGCGSVIGPGVTVGTGAFVGEGSVVWDDVPPHAVVYGNPARVTRRWTAADGWQGDMFGVQD